MLATAAEKGQPGIIKAFQKLGNDWRLAFSIPQMVGGLIGLLAWAIILSIELSESYPKANDMLAHTVLVACFWVFEVIPLPVTALLPVVLFPFSDIMTSKQASSSYWGWINMLFLGAFIVDIAIEHVGLHRRIALKVLLTVSKRPWVVMLAFMTISYFLSMWCSNTATTVMLVPFATGLLDTALKRNQQEGRGTDENGLRAQEVEAVPDVPAPDIEGSQLVEAQRSQGGSRRFSVAVLLSICYGSTCGGMATLIGTPPNGVLAGQKIIGDAIDSSNWFRFAIPVSACLLVISFLAIGIVYLRGVRLELDDARLQQDFKALGPISRDEICVAVIQLLQIGGWLIRKDVINEPEYTHPVDLSGVNDATIACAAALLPFVLPSSTRPGEAVLTWQAVHERLPWGVLLLFGGGFAIAEGFKASELTNYIGQQLADAVDFSALGFTYLVTLCVCFLTEVTSNTATANVILPILASVSTETLTHPLALMLPATLACSFAFMLPVATPPNMIVFGTGRVEILDFIRAGILINVFGVILCGLIIYAMGSAVYDIEGPFPEWACLPETCRWLAAPGVVGGRQVSHQACVVQQSTETCRLRNGTIINILNV